MCLVKEQKTDSEETMSVRAKRPRGLPYCVYLLSLPGTVQVCAMFGSFCYCCGVSTVGIQQPTETNCARQGRVLAWRSQAQIQVLTERVPEALIQYSVHSPHLQPRILHNSTRLRCTLKLTFANQYVP